MPPACKAGALPFELHPRQTHKTWKKVPMGQPGVEPGEASMLPIHHWRTSKRVWRSRVSIPVPADCEPTALPSELHPLTTDKKYVLQPMGFEPMPLSRLAPKASALTTRPNLHHSPRARRRDKKTRLELVGAHKPHTQAELV